MVLRFLLRYFSNNDHLIQKLSESYPMRRAAQIFISYFYRGKSLLEESEIRKTLTPGRLQSLTKRFTNNFKEELENAKQELKRKK